jgi:hypothetical protein
MENLSYGSKSCGTESIHRSMVQSGSRIKSMNKNLSCLKLPYTLSEKVPSRSISTTTFRIMGANFSFPGISLSFVSFLPPLNYHFADNYPLVLDPYHMPVAQPWAIAHAYYRQKEQQRLKSMAASQQGNDISREAEEGLNKGRGRAKTERK